MSAKAEMAGTLVVTGGAGGIGAATALLAARQGYDVCIGYLSRAAKAEEVAQSITELGRRVIAVQADVSDPDAAARLFGTADRELGPLTLVVNAAGQVARRQNLLDMDLAEMRRVVDVNLVGTMICCREAISRMSTARGRAGGAIVNIASEAGRFGGNGIAAYAAAKAGVMALTMGLAREAAPWGVRVNAVSPGLIDSGPNVAREAAASVPMGRLGTPAEVAEVALWLASDAAAYVCGATISVTGGR